MWVLTLVNNTKEEAFYVSTRKSEYLVGRANADLTLTGDSSISRKHTSIYIATREKCPFPAKTRTGLWVKDHGSKYGTYVEEGQDWIKIDPNTDKPILHGTYVRFGIISNVWRVEYKPLIICPSTLTEDETTQLRDNLVLLDGMLIPQFNSRCSYVVTPRLALSLKVILALINGIPIVTPTYINEICKAVKERSKWPDCKLFLPPLAELAIKKGEANFDYEQDRKALFKGLTFYVGTTEQLESLNTIVESAGGKIALFNSDNPNELLADGAVLLEPRQTSSQSQSQSQSHWNSDITVLLERKGRRPVPEREIPLAIVYASVDKHCNPTYMNFVPKLHPANSVSPQALASSIIEESTEPVSNAPSTSGGVVPATLSQQRVPSNPQPRQQSVFLIGASETSHKATEATQSPAKNTAPGSSCAAFPVTSRQPKNTTSLPHLSKESSSSIVKPPSIEKTSCSSSNKLFAAPARKRSGSLDIFEEELPSKRTSNSSNSVEIPGSKAMRLNSSNKPSLSNYSNPRRSPSPPPMLEKKGPAKDNPFGGNLVTSTPFAAGKRQLEDTEEMISNMPGKRQRVQDVTAVQRKRMQEVIPVLSRPDLIPRPVQSTSKPAVAEKTLPEANEFGFIDMSMKKEPVEESLGKTVIMMSMINLDRFVARSDVSVQGGLPVGTRNVKVFRKQAVLNGQRHISLQSLQTPEANGLLLSME